MHLLLIILATLAAAVIAAFEVEEGKRDE